MGWRQEWVAEKCDIATRLSSGEAGAGYAEATMVINAALSALAAELWPGHGIDRLRFIELLATIGPEENVFRLISIPYLIAYLKKEGRMIESDILSKYFFISNISFIYTGSDLDRSEKDVLSVCPSLNQNDLRTNSYASVLYKEIRSSYAHEYQTGKLAASSAMTTRRNERVSYVNEVTSKANESLRLIHFHIEWLLEFPIEIASTIDDLSPERPLARPVKWWGDNAAKGSRKG